MLAHDPGVRAREGSRGPPSDARRNAAAALGAEHGRADPRPGLGDRDAERARLARRGARPGARPRRPHPVPARRCRARSIRPTSKALAPLFRKLAKPRAVARRGVLEALRSERYLALLASIEAAAAGPPPGGAGSLRAEVKNEFKRLRKAMRQVEEKPTDEAIHQARIKGKRARYATELLEDELGKPGAEAARRGEGVPGRRRRASRRRRRRGSDPGAAARQSGPSEQRSPRASSSAGSGTAAMRAAAALPKAWRRYEEAARKVWA